MSALIDLMNQLAVTLLERRPPRGTAFTPAQVTFDPDGLTLSGQLDHPAASGPTTLRVTVQSAAPGRYQVQVRPSQPPASLAPELAPYRDVIERLQVQLDLDFSGPAPDAGLAAPDAAGRS
jgi:hypothetical protein